MAIITMIMAAVLVFILHTNFTTDQQQESEAQNYEIQESVLRSSTSTRNDQITMVPATVSSTGSDQYLGTNSSSSNPEELIMKSTTQNQIAISIPRLSLQIAPLQPPADEANRVDNMKNGLKIAFLVISVSATGIVSFLVGNSSSATKPSTTITTPQNKLLFRAVIVSMSASLFSAVILLILCLSRFDFSNLILIIVRVTIWISTSLMTVGVILLIVFYLRV